MCERKVELFWTVVWELPRSREFKTYRWAAIQCQLTFYGNALLLWKQMIFISLLQPGVHLSKRIWQGGNEALLKRSLFWRWLAQLWVQSRARVHRFGHDFIACMATAKWCCCRQPCQKKIMATSDYLRRVVSIFYWCIVDGSVAAFGTVLSAQKWKVMSSATVWGRVNGERQNQPTTKICWWWRLFVRRWRNLFISCPTARQVTAVPMPAKLPVR